MSATTKRCLTSGIPAKTCNWPKVQTKIISRVVKGEQKRAPVKSNEKDLRQRREMQKFGKQRGLW